MSKECLEDSDKALLEICNMNELNIPSNDNYKKFNEFIFSNDIKLIGKLLHRFEHFLNVKDLPGDIIEIGTFKGSGVSTFSKFIEVYAPNSNKKVIGFDIFGTDVDNILNKDSINDKEKMSVVYARVPNEELTLKSVSDRLIASGSKKHMLVAGDVEVSIPKFLEDNPGLRISMLYLDADLERPTYCALKYLWPRLLTGAVVMFDEFEYLKFSESNGFDKFIEELDCQKSKIKLKSTNWIAPTAYFYKV